MAVTLSCGCLSILRFTHIQAQFLYNFHRYQKYFQLNQKRLIAGADGNVSAFTLPGGLTTIMSGLGVLYPNGDETQRIGIVPDIEIYPTIKGIKEGKDKLLEKAFEIIVDKK